MNTVSILINVDSKVKAKAQKTARKMGLSLTSVINQYLKHFIAVETITFGGNDEKPSQYLIDSIKQSEADVKAGRVVKFKTGQAALDYLDKEIADEKRKHSSY